MALLEELEVREDARPHYRMLRRRGAPHDYAKRIAEGTGVDIPVLAGLDSGSTGFMRGRSGNDGCADSFTRRRVQKNLGGGLGGGMFVPGLCRPGKQFDGQAVCYSRQDIIDKAKKLGVAVRGPGINVEPRQDEEAIKAQEGDYTPSEQTMRHSIAQEVQQNHGGTVTRKKYREIVESLSEKHGQKKRPASNIKSIYPANT